VIDNGVNVEKDNDETVEIRVSPYEGQKLKRNFVQRNSRQGTTRET
jgi:hypothetical protein